MTPKEKAEYLTNELFDRSLSYGDACIAAGFLVDEVIEVLNNAAKSEGGFYNSDESIDYWQQVKQELEKL